MTQQYAEYLSRTGKVPGLGNLQIRKNHFLFYLLSFFFLKALLFAPHISASIFPFPGQASNSVSFSCASSHLLSHFHFPACLPLVPSGRWRSDGEEGEGTYGDFQAATWGRLPAHKSSSLCSSAKSNEMQWGATGQVRRRVVFSLSIM